MAPRPAPPRPVPPRSAPRVSPWQQFGCARQAISYIGLDIVKKVIETNLVKRDNMTRLVQADVVSLTQLPGPADLIFSRQMMQHMCNSDVRRVLDLISRSGARFALLTHFETDKRMANVDIHCNSGGYRPQDLLKPPFSLPPPIRYWCAHPAERTCCARARYVRLRCRSPRACAYARRSENYSIDKRVGLGLWALPLQRSKDNTAHSWYQHDDDAETDDERRR